MPPGEIRNYHRMQVRIANELRRADPSLPASAALQRSVAAERRWARRYMMRLIPWWSLLVHAALGLATHGAWLFTLPVHLLWAWMRLHRQRYPAPPRRPAGSRRRY